MRGWQEGKVRNAIWIIPGSEDYSVLQEPQFVALTERMEARTQSFGSFCTIYISFMHFKVKAEATTKRTLSSQR
jgi:hypothetical protein